jgi:CRISPR/Cas system CMR subunit Cmr6 (Cas7 group RAMP superfamily)
LGTTLLGLLNDQERFFACRANYTTFRTDSSSPNLAIFLTVLKGVRGRVGLKSRDAEAATGSHNRALTLMRRISIMAALFL